MPLHKYGVWKAIPVYHFFEYKEDDPKSPHLSLYFTDKKYDQHSHIDFHQTRGGKGSHRGKSSHRGGKKSTRGGGKKPTRGRDKEIPGCFRAAINIKSGDKYQNRLAYWEDLDFKDHPIMNSLADLPLGFHDLKRGQNSAGVNLDYIRSNLFNVDTGRILPHDEPGSDNDMIDALKPEIKQAIEEEADIYIFGEPFNDRKGIHNVHMNQGNIEKYADDDGVFQDGGLLINYPDSDRWVGVFIGFASQAVHTDDETGHAISSETWGDYLEREERDTELIEDSVIIDEALISPESDGPKSRRRSVTLKNPKNHRMSLSSWKIKNSAGEFHALPRGAALDAKSSQAFDIPDCHLSQLGDTITLLNEKGLKVDGVSYSSQQGVEMQPVVFAH
ncbi:hypothetical protein N7462_010963 [Penicillium macrosclerotiorum]|uniref:uncharacterized protein n=1 Tax=Penicillium macrosclerotiorum TaxID=303699 RepID=UPI0025492AA9|nr:uncharacterized protein N7462_010963 [Penicillium macrosclerotiorum]KAJ5669893.1 hypothetical protein N7462_010963 [Penicillium macrosclerotiorum]